MKNSEYIVPVISYDNLHVVRSTFPKSEEVDDTGFTEPQYDSFASKESALEYADELVKVGKVETVEVRHIIRIVHKK